MTYSHKAPCHVGLFLSILMLVYFFGYADANHGTLRIDPFNTNPINSAGRPTSEFGTDLREYIDHEIAQVLGAYLAPYVASGGTHGALAALTSAAIATEAYVPERINQNATAIT
mgnify:FL=1